MMKKKFLNLPYCEDCKKYIQFVDNKCFNYQSHGHLVTCNSCNYCQKDFKTFNIRQLR